MEAVRRAIEVFNRDGPEAATAFMDSEIEWHDMPEQPDAGVHHGREGFLAAVEQFAGGFEGFRVLVDEIFDHGDQGHYLQPDLWSRRGQRRDVRAARGMRLDLAKWINRSRGMIRNAARGPQSRRPGGVDMASFASRFARPS